MVTDSTGKTFSLANTLAGAGSRLFFEVYDPDHTGATKSTLWRTDGTPASTIPLRTFEPSYGLGLVPVSGGVFISASGGLWKSDGTSAGTVFLNSTAFEFLSPAVGVGSSLFYRSGNDDPEHFGASFLGRTEERRTEGPAGGNDSSCVVRLETEGNAARKPWHYG